MITSDHAPTSEVGEVDDGRCGVSTRVRRPPMVYTGEGEAITAFESQDLGSSSPVCKSNPTPRCVEEPTGIRRLLRKCVHCISDWVDVLE